MKYFGTDGIRGIYGVGITEDIAYRAGRAIAELIGGRGVVCRDTRLSGPNLESAFTSGATDGGAHVMSAGILPTPGAAFLTRLLNADFGVVISASHNPPEYNGIKIFTRTGKLPTSAEQALEYYMDNLPSKSAKGDGENCDCGRAEYIDHLLSEAERMGNLLGRSGRLDGMRVLLDSGNGAARGISREVFERLGARVGELCTHCNGECINVRCGALAPEHMAEEAKVGGYDMGLSFDGDADRLVVWRRRIMAGDEIMLNLSRFSGFGDKIVGTVMTNGALERTLALRGKHFVRTAVGDRNVSEVMKIVSANLGGEPSGHYILGDRPTGDGLLSGIAVCLLLTKGELENLELDKSKLISVPASGAALSSDKVQRAVAEAKKLAERIVVRMSGTEPLLRILAEGGDVDGAVELIRRAVE